MWFIVSHHAYLFTFLNLNWISGNGKKGTGWDGSWSAGFNETLSRNEDFPSGSDGKASAYNAGDLGSISGLGRSPREGSGNPLHNSCLEMPWTEEPGRLQSMGLQRVGHDWETFTFLLSRNELDTVKSVTFNKRSPKQICLCSHISALISAKCEHKPLRCGRNSQRSPVTCAAKGGSREGQGCTQPGGGVWAGLGRSCSARLCRSPGYSPHCLSWACPTVPIILTQSLSWLVYKIKVL